MKWLLAAVAAALLAGYVYWQRQWVKTTYVNGLAAYTGIAGREYIVERDCYIFKYKAHDTSWPLLGAHATVPELPSEVKESNVGAEFPAVRILGIVRIGDRFRIASVRRDTSRTEQRVTFEIVLVDESTRPFPRLDAYPMLDHSPEKEGAAPTILTDYAVLHGHL
ncbi:MAG TPA: hypothetical protein VII43_04555 [Opitutaceae bacterium]